MSDALRPPDRESQPETAPPSSWRWLSVFGPGAIIASLTIGAGELIFSARAGAIFGYRLLWYFVLILLFKWVLVFATARHMVLSGAHPFQRWIRLPGPAGWLPLVFLLLAIVAFPIWVSFHAGILGTLLASLLGWEGAWNGTIHFFLGMLVLAAVLGLVLRGGYQRLERIQTVLVSLMLACVTVCLILLQPDWTELAKGLFLPQALAYPAWLADYPEFASRPVWVETVTYAGVLGGGGYDYLAYVSYLREKQWGQAGQVLATESELQEMECLPRHTNRLWVKAIWVDCTLSFAAVLVFSIVFVACGAVVLEPQHKIPAGTNLLGLQAEFVTPVYPWLKYVYFSGAFLAMLGTLYGTIEVAPAVLRELCLALQPQNRITPVPLIRRTAVLWAGGGGIAILGVTVCSSFILERDPPGLVALLTPANLFTGVLSCGIICWLANWADIRFLPLGLRPARILWGLNLIGGSLFLALGLKGYWDHSGWLALLILPGTVAAGWLLALLRQQRQE